MRPVRLSVGLALMALTACLGPDTPVTVDPRDLPAPVLRGLALEPLVATPGQPLVLTVEATGTESDSLQLRFYPPPMLDRGGRSLARLLVYDDGTHGDAEPRDGIYTLDGLEPVLGPDGLGSWPVYLVDVQAPDPGSQTGDHPVKLAFRGVDPGRVPPPPVVPLAEDLRATPNLLVVDEPGGGDYTVEELAALSRRYYEVLPDDRDVLVVLHPPTFDNGASGGTYRVRNEVAGLGLSSVLRPEYGSQRELDVVIQIWGDIFSSGAPQGGRHCLLVHEMLHI